MDTKTYHEINDKKEIINNDFNSLEECREFCEKEKTVLFESSYYNYKTGKLIRLTSLVKGKNKYTIFRYQIGIGTMWFFSTIEKKDSDAEFMIIKLCKEYILNRDKP